MAQDNFYAGNLLEELEEINKTIPESEDMNVAGTFTANCSTILTIFCC